MGSGSDAKVDAAPRKQNESRAGKDFRGSACYVVCVLSMLLIGLFVGQRGYIALLINSIQLGLQFFTVQICSYDLALRIYEEGRWDTVDAIQSCGFAFPSLEIGNVMPGQVHFLDGIQPRCLVAVE